MQARHPQPPPPQHVNATMPLAARIRLRSSDMQLCFVFARQAICIRGAKLHGLRALVERRVGRQVPFAATISRTESRDAGRLGRFDANVTGLMRGAVVDNQINMAVAAVGRLVPSDAMQVVERLCTDPYARDLFARIYALGLRPVQAQCLIADKRNGVATAIDVLAAHPSGDVYIVEMKTSSNRALHEATDKMHGAASLLDNSEFNQQHLVLALAREMVIRCMLEDDTLRARVHAIIIRATPRGTDVEQLNADAARVAHLYYNELLEPVHLTRDRLRTARNAQKERARADRAAQAARKARDVAEKRERAAAEKEREAAEKERARAARAAEKEQAAAEKERARAARAAEKEREAAEKEQAAAEKKERARAREARREARLQRTPVAERAPAEHDALVRERNAARRAKRLAAKEERQRIASHARAQTTRDMS